MQKVLMIFLILLSLQSKADSEAMAIKKATKALYKQTGLDKHIKRLEKEYIPEIIRNNGWVLALGDAVIKKQYKVKYEWKF